MPSYRRLATFAIAAVLSMGLASRAATFGTAVPVRGTVSDIALDESRGRLYIANFGANRIDVMNTRDPKFALGTPMLVSKPPSAVALSPGNHFLVAGEYFNVLNAPAMGGLAIFNLDMGTRLEVTLTNPVLSVAFGAGNLALVVTTGEFMLLDPASGRTVKIGVMTLDSAQLPATFALCAPDVFSFPVNIVDAATGVSGDQQTILILAQVSTGGATVKCTGDQKVAALLRYHVGDSSVSVFGWTASPPLGPRTVSVNRDGSRFAAGWVLTDSFGADLADFPNLITTTPTDYRKGGHAFDYLRNLIYADILAATTDPPVMHIVDTDNLTVRNRVQLPQMMSGRSLFSSDMSTLYTGSDSGVMVLPVGSLDKLPQISALQEDVVFQSDVCTRNVITQSIDIVDPSGGNTDFRLSLPDGTSGIAFSQTSGTTPAKVAISVDPTVFQSNSGTTTVMLSLQSAKAVNIPSPVRLLINTRDMGQRGQIVNVPGKLVDILADPSRSRVYVLRQDKNVVLVYDTTTWKPIDAPGLRTGNTPTSMAITQDQRYLLVGNDHSQLINVFDLQTLQPYAQLPYIRSDGGYPASIAVGQGIGTQVVWAAIRDAAPPDTCSAGRILFRANFPAKFASAPTSLGIYENCYPSTYNGSPRAPVVTASPSGQSVMLAIPDGTVSLWDGTVDEWVLARQDVKTLGGAYGALSDNIFITGNRVLDQGLFAEAELQTATTATTSGVGLSGGAGSDGLRTTTGTASGPGILERIDFNPDNGPFYLQSYSGTPTIEAPHTAATLQTLDVGQIGQTISTFTRTLAVPADRSSIVLLSQSGLTVLPPDFDAATKVPVVSSVTSTNGDSAVAPDEQVLINGTGLAPGSAVAGVGPLPSTLGDACVTLSNVALPLFWVSPTQIKAVLPSDAGGSEQLVVHSPGGVSSPFTFQVQTTAPAFLPVDSGSQAGLPRVIRQKNGQVVNFTNPVHSKESLSIYMTGLGTTVPAVAPGDVAPANPPALVVAPVTVTLGGTNLPVTFAGLAPGEVSAYRVDVSVPYFIRGASQSPLVVSQGTISTSTMVRVVTP